MEVITRAGTIHLIHNSIYLDGDSIQNEYSIVVNRYGTNLFVSNLKELQCMHVQLISLIIHSIDNKRGNHRDLD